MMTGAKRLLLTAGLFLFVSLMTVQLSMAEVRDEFDSPGLDTSLWEMKIAGGASYEISGGSLKMSSPDVDSGIMIYYPVNVADLDISFEVKLDTSGVVDNLVTGFLADLMDPQVNTEINNNWEANLFFVPDNWYIKQDPIVVGEKPPNPGIEGQYLDGWNVAKIDINKSSGKVTFYMNGEQVGEVDRNPDVESRYFYVSPDTYTSHYTGEITLDYIEIGGPDAPSAAAVEPVGKLASTWGRMKQSY